MILSILDTNDLKKLKRSYFIGIIFIMLFSFIYEMFSHGVISLYMVLAFIYPLIGLIVVLLFRKKRLNFLFINLLNGTVVSFTLYGIIHGILDIYGTTNILINIYLYLGFGLMILSFISLYKLSKN